MSDSTRDPELVALLARRDDLLRSIDDLDREHGAGDVDDADYAQLRQREVARAADVLRSISEREDQGEQPRSSFGERSTWRRFRRYLGRRRVRRVLAVGAAVAVLLAIATGAAEIAGVRLPGEDATGTVTVPTQTQINDDLAIASDLEGEGAQQFTKALEVYQAVLVLDPNNAEALAYTGWIEHLAGDNAHNQSTIRLGEASLRRAVMVAPAYPDGRGLDGIVLLDDEHDLTGALVQFHAFLADHPSAVVLGDLGHEIAAAFEQAGQAVPSVLRPYEAPSKAPTGK